ncbi:hypothetical protein J2Z83_002902 [Virgibacillus natechei]|uniref:Uncharacterized protein n=1 Tax=Virgibacillus natechei TaxID=1216297 RepID=A0ABS4IJZ9_9BACI|nr:hypothetical protein [Virgibacillus natechei]
MERIQVRKQYVDLSFEGILPGRSLCDVGCLSNVSAGQRFIWNVLQLYDPQSYHRFDAKE